MTHFSNFRHFAILACSAVFSASAIGTPGASEKIGLTPQDSHSAKSLVRSASYQVTWQDRDGVWAYRASNEVQGFTVAFAQDGLHIQNDDWEMKLAPATIGDETLPDSVDVSRLQGFGNKVDYTLGHSVAEEWENTPQGVRQTLTLFSPPAAAQSEPSLTLRVGGNLTVSSQGNKALLTTREGTPVLFFGPVAVHDADGYRVEATLRITENRRIAINIEDEGAIYPLTVKATIHSAEAILRPSETQAQDRFGVSVSVSGDTAVVGAYQEDGGTGDPMPNAGAAYVFQRNQGGPDAWGEVAILRASNAQAGDSFGWAVAIAGDTVVVSAKGEDGGGNDPLVDSGAAYIFERNRGGADAWGEVTILRASDRQAGDDFGESVAIDGDTVVVGAELEDGGAGDTMQWAGAAYVYERDRGGADAWGQVRILRASDSQAFDRFGSRLGVSGDVVVVTAPYEDGGASDPIDNAGAAYIFERNHGGADAWGEVIVLRASDAQIGDYFGSSVAIRNDRTVVGAWSEDGGEGDPLTDAGAAYVFERNQGGPDAWGEVAILRASDAQDDDRFGAYFSVALDGERAAVGAWREDGGEGDPLTDSGAAYVFERNQGGTDAWGEVRTLRASDAQGSDVFGISAAISGTTVIVGALWEDGGAGDTLADAGAAYIYDLVGDIFADGFESGDTEMWSSTVPTPQL